MNKTQGIQAILNACKSYTSAENEPLPQTQALDDYCFVLAKRHRITIPLAPYFANGFKEKENKRTEEELKEHNQTVKLKMLKLSHEIIQLHNLFDQENLSCFFLKGPIYAKYIYNDYAAKDSRDIDLLIHENQVEACFKTLEQHGYEPLFKFQNLNERQKKYFKKTNNQLAFFHKKKQVLLEVHWRLFANNHLLPIAFQELKTDSQSIRIANNTFPIFSDEHLLLYLIAHGAKHKWKKLYWLLEISVLIQNTKFEWQSVLLKARKFNVERMLFQALLLIQDLFKISSPIKVSKTAILVHLVEEVKTDIFNEISSPLERSIKNYWSFLRYKMKLKNSISYKLNHFHFISIHDFKALPLPESLFSLYYLSRPFLWAKRYLFS